MVVLPKDLIAEIQYNFENLESKAYAMSNGSLVTEITRQELANLAISVHLLYEILIKEKPND
jgi:hypothetical protein